MVSQMNRKFTNSYEISEEVAQKMKRALFLFILNVILGCAFLYFCVENYEQNAMVVIFPIIAAISIVSSIISINQWSIVLGNIRKNELEITDTYISGVYTDCLTKSDTQKYFRIQYEKIDKIEVRQPDVQAKSFHNFFIYHENGLVQLSIETPNKAKETINDMKQKEVAEG